MDLACVVGVWVGLGFRFLSSGESPLRFATFWVLSGSGSLWSFEGLSWPLAFFFFFLL